MKRHTASQLTSLLKAKTQLERFQYENIKNRHASATQKALALHQEAISPPATGQLEDNTVVFRVNETRISELLKRAKTEQLHADSMLGALGENLSKVKAALQRELALKELSKKLDEEHRAANNKQEESQHEHIRSLKKITPPM